MRGRVSADVLGVEGDMSLYRVARSTGGFSTNCFPRLTITNSVTANTTCGVSMGISMA